jgi:phage recombination protein Bet
MKPKAEAKALVQSQSTAESSRAPAEFITRERVELLKRTLCRGASDDELALFLQICERTRLDPFSKQIYGIRRWDSRERREILQVQLSIDALRLLASRTGEYLGQAGPYWCGTDGVWHDVWIPDEPPLASKVGVHRAKCLEPIWGIARFTEYCQLDRDGNLTGLWRKMPATMISKCAEASALRKGFPAELAGLYSIDEMAQADRDGDPPPVVSIAATREAAPEPKHGPKPEVKPESPERPWSTFRGMIDEFGRLKARLPPEAYYEVLGEHGVRHCNEFRDARKAAAAYHKLLEYEAAKSAEESAIDAAAMIEEIAAPDTPPDEEAML